MRYISPLTNLIYVLSAYVHLLADHYSLAAAMFFLAFASFGYHWQLAEGLDSDYWRYADMSAIYTVLALYPFALSGSYLSLLMILPAALVILNKWKLLAPDFEPNSTYVVIALALPTLILAYYNVPADYFYSAIAFLALAKLLGYIAGKFPYLSEAYDTTHGAWHVMSGIAFILIV